MHGGKGGVRYKESVRARAYVHYQNRRMLDDAVDQRIVSFCVDVLYGFSIL
jgi:hypothetical protein